jgi:hypothetical protein
MVLDIVGTLRRARVVDQVLLSRALAEMPVAAAADPTATIAANRTATDWYAFSNGDHRLFDLVTTEQQAEGLRRTWRGTIREHPGPYITHRLGLARQLFGVTPPRKWAPVYDYFGDPEHLAMISHRASASAWQTAMRTIVRVTTKTPLFKPWLYLPLAIGALFTTRRWPAIRAVAISGLLFAVAAFFAAPGNDYRYAHWLVTAATIGLAAALLARRSAWRRTQ